ncbi:MAG: alanine racemase [Mariprofundus sp.]|nr:alanine racemase [Mariprofundus sp.]
MSRPAIAHIYPEHLRHNYRLLQQHAGAADIMAIVKANAYGHGIELVAPILFDEGCRNFGVTDATEGCQLRQRLPNSDTEITLLSGIFDQQDARQAADNQLTPAITESTQLEQLHMEGFQGSVWIKVDTGMNRLGASDVKSLIKQCQQTGIHVCGLMSHLACADTPEHPLNRQQANAFTTLRRKVTPNLPASLLNSAGMVSMPEHRLDIVRPGIALYGSEPVADQPFGLKPVMQLTGGVMQVREIQAGDQVSYGATYSADNTMRIAVISMGYADGLPRGLGNRGYAFFAGQQLDIVGRVCMDYTMLDVTDVEIRQGDSVEFWGDNLLANDVARSLGTISYALFTGVGVRVQRIAEYSG